MEPFEFLTVVISIVIAVAMSEVLVGWGRIIRFRGNVHTYWLHTGWSAVVLLIMLRYWWSTWQFRAVEEWTFPLFVLILAPALLLILIAFLLTPELSSTGEFRFREYYYENAGWFFSLAALYLAGTFLSNSIVRGRPPWAAENAFRAFGIILLAAVAFSRRELVHRLVFGATLVLLLIFMASVQFALG